MRLIRSQIIEIVGLISVVASLLFVGFQLYLDRKLAIATQYAARAESVKSDYRAQLESEAYLSAQGVLWRNGNRPPWWTEEMEKRIESAGYTAEQFMALYRNNEMTIVQFDNLYFQYQQGFLSEDFWNSTLDTIRFVVSTNEITAAIYLNRLPRLPIADVLEDMFNELPNKD